MRRMLMFVLCLLLLGAAVTGALAQDSGPEAPPAGPEVVLTETPTATPTAPGATSTRTATATPTGTRTATATASATTTSTRTATATLTATATATPTATGTRTPTATVPGATATGTATATATRTATATATRTATATATPTGTRTLTPSPSATATRTPTAALTATVTRTATVTATPGSCVLLPQQQLVLSPVADTYIFQAANKPEDATAWTGNQLKQAGSWPWYRSLLRFDLSAIPTGSKVDSASLRMTVLNWYPANDISPVLNVAALGKPFDPSVSWTLANAGQAWTSPGAGAAGADYLAPAGSLTVKWGTNPYDVAAPLRQIIEQGAPNHGLILWETDGRSATFYSVDEADAARRPSLTLLVRPCVPPTATPTRTPTRTPTAMPTPTVTASRTATPTAPAGATATRTPTPTATGSSCTLLPPEQAVLGPVADTYLFQAASKPEDATAWAGNRLKNAGYWPWYRSLLRFDLSAIPAGSKVDSASLRLTLLDWYPANDISPVLSVAALGKPFDASVNWTHANAALAWTSAGAAGAGSDYLLPAGTLTARTGAYGYNVTGPLQKIIEQGAPNYGLILWETDGRAVSFYSMEEADASRRPALTVNYRPCAPVSGSATPTRTRTATPALSPTPTATPTRTPVGMASPTATPTATRTPNPSCPSGSTGQVVIRSETAGAVPDTYIFQAANKPEDASAWSGSLLKTAGYWPSYRSLVRFDIAGLPAGALVDKATLRMTIVAWYPANNINPTIIFAALGKPFDQAASWNMANVGQAWTSAGAAGAGSDYVDPVKTLLTRWGTNSFDVTTPVSRMVGQGAANHGFLFWETDGREATFASSDDTDLNRRPSLTIDYRCP